MGVKAIKATSNARRNISGYTFEEVTVSKPEKALTKNVKRSVGRNSAGRITIRHKGGGHARKYRYIDFYYIDKKDIPAKIKTIEYDPFRTAYIALAVYLDGEKRYVLAHKDMQVGDEILTADLCKPVVGNRMKIKNIPVGFNIYNVELMVDRGAGSVRSAGSYAKIVSQEGEYTQLKLPSGEVRLVHKECYASIGIVSNVDHRLVKLGKAGRSRWKGIRPTVRGKVMNPVDHPHGGGEGRNSIGMKYPKTPWGQPALGVKTRKRKSTNKWISQDRKGKIIY